MRGDLPDQRRSCLWLKRPQCCTAMDPVAAMFAAAFLVDGTVLPFLGAKQPMSDKL